jgi:hypothetical protein
MTMDNSHYGRKWELKILCNDGTLFIVGSDGISELQGLKVTFDVNCPGYEGWYLSEFVIYNPNTETERKIIREGAEVYFSAGYSEGNYGQIFGGKVFQSLFERENITDYKLTLMCMDGARLFKDNFASFTLNKNYSEQTLINEIAARSDKPIEIGKVTPKINDAKRPRGTTIFCVPSNGMRYIARNSNAQVFMKEDKVYVSNPTDSPSGKEIEINTSTGLIGTPVQMDYGVNFRTLLNPELIIAYPPKWVKLDLSGINIKQMKAVPGSKKLVPILSPVSDMETAEESGFFQIGGVRHYGDTRGNDWYTEVAGYSYTGKAGLNLLVPEMYRKPSSNGN